MTLWEAVHKPIACPNCGEVHGVTRILSYNVPVSSALPLIFDILPLWLFLCCLPKRYRCARCHFVFRKFSLLRGVAMTVFILVFGALALIVLMAFLGTPQVT